MSPFIPLPANLIKRLGTRQIYNSAFFASRKQKTFFPCSYRVYRNTCGSLGETRNCVETLASCSCSHAISRFSQTSTCVSITLYRNTENVFYFLNNRTACFFTDYDFAVWELTRPHVIYNRDLILNPNIFQWSTIFCAWNPKNI